MGVITLGGQLQHSNDLYAIVDINDIRGGVCSVATFDDTSLTDAFSAIPDKLKTNYTFLLDRSTGSLYYLSGTASSAGTTGAWTPIAGGGKKNSSILNFTANSLQQSASGDWYYSLNFSSLSISDRSNFFVDILEDSTGEQIFPKSTGVSNDGTSLYVYFSQNGKNSMNGSYTINIRY